MIPAIAFVPTNRVCEYFELLSDALPDEMEPILVYYEDNCIGRRRCNRRRNARYPHDLWNVFNESLGEEPKTTNSIEGWHRTFSRSLGTVHPNIWKFIEFLRSEKALNAAKQGAFVAGRENRSQKKYADAALRIKNIFKKFETTQLLVYLRFLAFNFNF